ncbi:sugar efflux transporter [Saccharothrix syringae]|uniref:sugar efflux transporter n=1 Tax=Saccharothrix syringae TaxID=103733 RepID=UPI0007C4899B|nr:sugar efflux transporter [Saccharothrix syringae]
MEAVTDTPSPSRARSLVPLFSVSLLTGVGYALAGPFMSVFLIKQLQAGPVAVGAFLLVSSLGSIAVSTVVGRVSDSRAIRRLVLLTASSTGAVAWLLFAFVREYWLLLVVSVTLMAIASSQVPQVFAYARQVLDQTGSTRAPLAMSGLRTVMSLSWVAGPPLGAVLMAGTGFTGLFGVTALFYVLAAAAIALWLPEPGVPEPASAEAAAEPPAARAEVLLASVAFVLLQGATSVGVAAMPLFVPEVLGGTTTDAGLVLGLCAALEIPLMLGFGALAVRHDQRRLVLLGGAVALAYYAVVLAAQATWQVMAAQVLHAVVISAVMGVGISYFQNLAPDRPGYATTLHSNTFKISAMLSGPLLGVAQQFGYRSAYGIGLVMSVLGLALLLAARPRRQAGYERWQTRNRE